MPVGQINYARSQAVADRMIRKGGMQAVLRRPGMADRPCSVLQMEFSPMERMGKPILAIQLVNPTDRKFIVSTIVPGAGGTLIAPDAEQDALVTFVQPPGSPPVQHEVLRIVAPVGKSALADVVVFWRLTVRR
jgi:hypothetical protein